MKTNFTRKTYYASSQSEQDTSVIKEKYGLATESDAIRLALRLVAESSLAQLPKKKTPK